MLVGIIMSYNSSELTDKIYEDLIPFANDDFKLFVFDNGSDDKEISRYTTHRVFKNIRMTNGFNCAIDMIKEARESKYLWLISNDIELVSGNPHYFIKAFEDHPKAALIHPSLTPESITSWSHMIRQDSDPLLKIVWMADIIAPVFRTKTFLEIGKFNSLLTRGWGIDYESAYKIYGKGFGVYMLKEVVVWHKLGGTYRSGRGGEPPETRDNQATMECHEILGRLYGSDWYKVIFTHNNQRMVDLL